MLKKFYKLISLFTIVSLVMLPMKGYSLPEGEQVIDGSATFDRSQTNTLNINQGTDKLIANYNSFSIAQPEAVHFLQPSSSSVALNRVIGGDPSSILGTLTATGKIFLINPNGVLFGAGCHVDTAGLVASTLNMSNADFMAGRYTFLGNGGAVVNQGYISAPGGFVALLGSSVENTGVIEAELGSIALASGNATTLNLDPNGYISVVVDEATIANLANKDDAVKNTGTLKADGGKVILTAKTLEGVFNKAINTTGIIEANTLGGNNGEVILEANDRVNVAGTISAEGGKVTINSEGADFSGTINTSKGVYNMHDGDTIINPVGTFTGDQSWYDDENIDVIGNINVTDDGDIEIFADNDDNGSGDLTVTADITSQGGDIYLEGANVDIEDALIETIAPIASGPQDVGIDVRAHNSNGIINVNDSELNARVPGEGDALVNLVAGNYEDYNTPEAKGTPDGVDVYGDNYGDGIVDHIETLSGTGHISITNGSNIEASIGSGDTASIGIKARDIDINDSFITALAQGDGASLIDIYAAANFDYRHAWWDYQNRTFTGGNLNITNSGILASVDNGSGWSERAEINLLGDNITLDGSAVVAQQRLNGQAFVNIEAGNFVKNEKEGYEYNWGGELNILNPVTTFTDDEGMLVIDSIPSVAALVGENGQAEVDLTSGGTAIGTINITSASVKSLVKGIGDAYVGIHSGNYLQDSDYEEGDFEYSWSDSEDFYGSDLNIAGSTISAEVLGAVVEPDHMESEATVELDAGNINIDSSSVSAKVTGSGDAAVLLFATDEYYDEQSETGEELVDSDYAYMVTESHNENSYGGSINIQNGSDISAKVDGTLVHENALVQMKAGDITVNNSTANSELNGYGNAEVDMYAGDRDYESLNEMYYLEENEDPDLSFETWTETIAGGSLEINNSNVSATVFKPANIEGGYDTGAYVDLEAGAITIDPSTVSAQFTGNNGDAEVYMFAAEGSESNNCVDCETSYGGSIDIIDSSVLSTATDGDAEIYLETGTEEPGESRSYVNILNSKVIADVNGEGHAGVYIYNEFGEMDLLGDSLLSDIDLGWGGDMGTSIVGPINIENSLIHAEAASENDGATSVVYMNTADTLSVIDSEISTSELSGITAIALLADGINIDSTSAVSASVGDGLALVAAISENDINSEGTISANGGDGFGLVALGAGRDISTGTINATGNLDTLCLLEDLINGDVGPYDSYLDIMNQYNYGSAVLLGSLGGNIYLGNIRGDLVGVAALGLGYDDYYGGNIYDKGLVSANYLAMMARHDIGTCLDDQVEFPGPINTDVNILSAYSWDYGDIYINEANSLEVGLFLPINLNYYEYDSDELLTRPLAAIGASVAANDGIVHIVSNGDMLVNSIISPRGGVFLQSLTGSIYAGHALDPRLDCEDAFGISHGISDLASNFGLDICPFTINRIAFMRLNDTPWSYEADYFTPLQFGCYLRKYVGDYEEYRIPNVIAGGYSYFSTPQGTIGVGFPEDKNPAISGEVTGTVWPAVEAITGYYPSPGIDLSRYTPPGLVYFTPDRYVDPQIWPAAITDPEITSGNPLVVNIQVMNPEDTSALPDWFLNSLPPPPVLDGEVLFTSDIQMPRIAALTLEIGPPIQPPNPTPLILDPTTQLAGPLVKNFRAYYEILDLYRFVSFEPATPTTFYAYHPLTSTDESAFDGITLDTGAYDFIEDNIKLKKRPAPYFGVQ